MNNNYKKAMDKIELSDEVKEKIINKASESKINQNSKFNLVPVRIIAGLAACLMLCFLSHYAVTNYYLQLPENVASVNTPKPSPENIASGEKLAAGEPVQEEKPSLKEEDETESVISSKKEKKISNSNSTAYKKAEATDSQTEIISPKQATAVASEYDLPDADNELPRFAKGKTVTEDNNDNSESSQLTMEQIVTKLGYEIKSPQEVPVGYEISNMSVVGESVAEITYQSENDIITYRTAKSSEDLSQKNDTYEFAEIVNVNNTDIILKGNEELYYNAVWNENEEVFSITSDNGVEKSVMVDMGSSVDYEKQSDPDTDSEN